MVCTTVPIARNPNLYEAIAEGARHSHNRLVSLCAEPKTAARGLGSRFFILMFARGRVQLLGRG